MRFNVWLTAINIDVLPYVLVGFIRDFRRILPCVLLIFWYYYKSKRFYLEREPDYKSFCNILRQICKSHDIKIESKLNYCNSSYMMEYYISRTGETVPVATESETLDIPTEK